MASYVTDQNKDRIVALFGIPFDTTKEDIIDFMHEFEIDSSDIILGFKGNKPSGKAIVFLKNEEEVEKA